jgi:phosphoribosylformylglycinamidine synthase
VLPGPAALTAFEAERLAARLRGVDAGVSRVDAACLYILRMREHATAMDEGRLRELLEAGDPLPAGECVWIAPRVGTQSPWSSKATDILHNTGFEAIERIERARAVRVTGARSLPPLAALLHDRMTESVFFEGAEELLGLFEAAGAH